MGGFLGGVAAVVVGAGLGAATVVGVVQSQAASDSPTQPTSSVVNYGSNN